MGSSPRKMEVSMKGKRKERSSSKYLVLVVTAAITTVLALIINYLALPARTIHSTGYWCFWILTGIIAIVVSIICHAISNEVNDDYYDESFWQRYTISVIIIAITALAMIASFIVSISSWKINHADEYANLIEITEGKFEEDIPKISDTAAVIVDMKTAQKLGDRTIGTIPHASWYEVDDEYDLIEVAGEYYRISSIKYAGLFAYNKAKNDGIPGYVLVNAKTQEAQYVQLEKGMKYAPSAFWSEDLTRHLHNQYPSYILGKSFFEIDDEYTPYWITNVRTPKIGLR